MLGVVKESATNLAYENISPQNFEQGNKKCRPGNMF